MRAAPFLLLVCLLAACTGRLAPDTTPAEPGPPVDIAAPASGALTDAQLAAIAADIRELEANPLGLGAEEARAALVAWLVASPDVSVRVCSGIARPFTDSESFYSAELFGHFTLGLAASAIETPEAGVAERTLAAVRSAITAYNALLDRDPRATDRHMNRMILRDRAATLDEFVESATISCG